MIFLFSGLEAPVISAFHFPKKINSRQQRVMVGCNIESGDPPFDFKWRKDGKDLNDNDYLTAKVLDEFTSRLTIFKLGPESIGNYSCRASNSAGFDEKHDMLIINGMLNICEFGIFVRV